MNKNSRTKNVFLVEKAVKSIKHNDYEIILKQTDIHFFIRTSTSGRRSYYIGRAVYHNCKSCLVYVADVENELTSKVCLRCEGDI